MSKFFIATIAMGFFLISTQAAGAGSPQSSKSQLKPVSISKAVKPHKYQKSKKSKKHVTSISFEQESPKVIAKHRPSVKKKDNKTVQIVAKKNFKAIVCQDGYVVKNQAFCAIAKTKAIPSSIAKKAKANRQIASSKESEVKKATKAIKK